MSRGESYRNEGRGLVVGVVMGGGESSSNVGRGCLLGSLWVEEKQ